MIKFIRMTLFIFLGVFVSEMGFGYNAAEFWVILVVAILIQITANVEGMRMENDE